ncbi:MAG: ATP-binding protein [Clostridia bacterium]|nr:ATP-binding protein [Clostridia bacterium]
MACRLRAPCCRCGPRRGRDVGVIPVEDDGCGIDDADMPHLFNPFFTKKKYGTGLGLSQVLKIVEVHQGKLEIISEKEKGTKVCVTLPCNEKRRTPRV